MNAEESDGLYYFSRTILGYNWVGIYSDTFQARKHVLCGQNRRSCLNFSHF